ncbi:MAG: hypothetical protein CMJ14_04495 [Pelagibacterales bacterium]|nr:hypothetical protein [Pelagibacterales bacterium]
MDILNIFYIVLLALTVLLISITIWSRRPFRWRISGFFIGATLISLLFISILELLSRPKPAHLELFYKDIPEVVLLHASWEEEVALYILVEIPGVEEPRLYILPWSREDAEQFEQAMQEGEDNNEEVRIGNPFFNTDEEDRERLVYTSPAKPMPQKGREQLPVTNFDPDAEQPAYGEEENN